MNDKKTKKKVKKISMYDLDQDIQLTQQSKSVENIVYDFFDIDKKELEELSKTRNTNVKFESQLIMKVSNRYDIITDCFDNK